MFINGNILPNLNDLLHYLIYYLSDAFFSSYFISLISLIFNESSDELIKIAFIIAIIENNPE